MSPQELAFILKMHDEASATMKKIGQSLRGAGDEAKGAQQDTKKYGDELTKLKKHATDLIATFAGLKASMAALGATSGAHGQFEANIARVASVAAMSKQEMRTFTEEFRQLNREIKVIPTDQLAEMTATLAQMGVANKDLASMGSTVAKLSMASGEAAEYVAEVSQRLLYVTGEGMGNLNQFGDTLSWLDRNAAATSKGILDMANNLAIAAPQFKFSSQAILAISTSMANAGMRSEITRSAVQRVMASLYSGSKKGSTAFQDFINRVGMTKDEFDRLAQSNPEEILLRFSDAYNAMNERGQGKDFLKQFGIQAQETEIVLGVLGKRSQEVRGYLEQLDQGVQSGDLQRRFEIVNETQVADLQGMLKAWDQLKAAIGEAIAPLVTPVLEGLTEGAYLLRDIFTSLSAPVRFLLGAVITLGPAILVAVRAARLLKGVFTLLAGSGGIAGALLGAKSSVEAAGDALGDAAGKSAGRRFGLTTQRMLNGLKLMAKVGLVIEGGKLLGQGIASVINKYLPEQAAAFADWRDDPDNWFGSAINTAGGWLGVEKGRSKWDAQREAQQRQQTQEALPPTMPEVPPVDTESPLAGGGMPSKTLHEVTLEIQEQIDEVRALTGAAKERVEMERMIRQAVDDTGMGYDEVRSKIGGLISDLQRARAAAAVSDILRDYDQQIEAAQAVTGEQKQQVEVQQQLNDLAREHTLTLEQQNQIRQRANAAFVAERAAAYAELMRDTGQQLIALQAQTQEARDYLEVVKEIADFERERGRLTDEQRLALAQQLTQIKQIEEFQRMQDQYDPVGTARRRYDEERRTLDVMRAQNVITQDTYNRMRQNLDERTRAQRDPIGQRVKEMREELNVLRMSIDAQDTEKQVLQEVNALRQSGLEVSREMTDAIREYVTAMQDYELYSTSGIGGFVNSVGTLREGLMDLTQDFASGLSGAISGALKGDKNAFRNFAQQLGSKMIDWGVNQLTAQMFKAMGATNPQEKALDRAQAAITKIESLGSQLQTPQAIINAGQVSINGQALNQALNAANDNAAGAMKELPNLTSDAVEQAVAAVRSAPGGGSYAEVGNFVARGAGKVDQRLRDILEEAAIRSGYKVEAYSGYRPGDSRMHGKGLATDVRLFDQNSGRLIGGSQHGGHYQTAEGFRDYERFAQEARRVQMEKYPELSEQFRWGGYFGTQGRERAYGALDGMHFDLGGRNGLGMAGGSWEGGLAPHMRAAYAGIQSQGMGAVDPTTTGSIQQATQQMQQASQQIAQAVQPATQALQQAGTNMQTSGQQVQIGTQQASTAMQQLNMAQQQTGQAATQTGQQFQQAGQQIAAAGTQATTAAGSGGGAGFAGLASQIASAAGGGTGGAGGMGSIMSSMLPMLMQFLPPPFNLLGGLLPSIFGGLFADGGQIKGPGTGTSDSILAAVSNGEFIVNAKSTKEWGPVLQAINDNKMPKFKNGGMVGGGNVVALGERAMVSGRKPSGTAEVAALADQVSDLSRTMGKAMSNGRNRINNNSMNVTVHAKDADSFRRSEGQLLGDAQLKISRFGNRNN